jgi:hypothetical protein
MVALSAVYIMVIYQSTVTAAKVLRKYLNFDRGVKPRLNVT